MIAVAAASHLINQPRVEPVVLIANSNDAARRWIEATATAAGLHARSFATGAGLLAQFRTETAACVILDTVLNDASGLRLQEEFAGAGVATLSLTREPCIAACVQAVKAGAVDFLTMPCDALDIIRALRHAVAQTLALRMRRMASSELNARYQRLTVREREIFALVSSGLLNKQIAHRLAISDITVQIHRSRVMKKMCASSFASLVRMADALQLQQCDGRRGEAEEIRRKVS